MSDIFEASPESLKDRLFEFPEYGILPFRPSDLDEEEREHLLYQLEDNNKELRKLFQSIFKNVA